MADNQSPPPFVPEPVVEWLSRLFPDRCPRGPETDREIWQASGAQKVISKLRDTVNKQRAESLQQTEMSLS